MSLLVASAEGGNVAAAAGGGGDEGDAGLEAPALAEELATARDVSTFATTASATSLDPPWKWRLSGSAPGPPISMWMCLDFSMRTD